MKFKRVKQLAVNDSPDGFHYETCNDFQTGHVKLWVSDTAVQEWIESDDPYGYWTYQLFPAITVTGKEKVYEKCFLKYRRWTPAMGYNADGMDEVIISLDEGFQIIREQSEWSIDPSYCEL